MDAVLRPIVEDELGAFVRADAIGFGAGWRLEADDTWPRAELDRTVAAFVDDEIVATGRNFSLEMTMPGGTVVPTGAVSWISTRPTHRRRGLLRRIMEHLVLDSRARGESMSILTASEGGIYERFGYGVATRKASIAVSRSATTFRDPAPEGRVRIVEPTAAAEIARPLFDCVRRSRVGAVSRPDAWWNDEWASTEWIYPRQRFDVVYEEHGRVEGYALYAISGGWSDGFTEKYVAVRDVIASSPRAEHALWYFLFNIDQTVEMRCWNTPVDSELGWLLTDPRECRTVSLRDWTWIRPIDASAVLASRSYGTHDELVVDVRDRWLGLEETAGTFRVRSGTDGVTCVRTDRTADLELDADALGSIILGGVAPSTLARARRIAARDVDALTRADAMFRAEREPFGYTWF